jgi:uncharacterized protein YecT (DUF1311 family)
MRASRVQACENQTNDWLNDSYEFLLNNYKNSQSQTKLLQKTQQKWLQKRNAKCGITKNSTASNEVLAKLRCRVLLTYKRANDLENILLSLDT